MNQRGLIGWIIFLVTALTLGGGGVVIMSARDSIPGDLIYPVKELVEVARIITTEGSHVQRADTYVDFSDERISEIQKLVVSNKAKSLDKISANLTKMLDAQEKALGNLSRAYGRGEDIEVVRDKLDNSLRKQANILFELLHSLPEPVSSNADQALKVTEERLKKMLELKRGGKL